MNLLTADGRDKRIAAADEQQQLHQQQEWKPRGKEKQERQRARVRQLNLLRFIEVLTEAAWPSPLTLAAGSK